MNAGFLTGLVSDMEIILNEITFQKLGLLGYEVSYFKTQNSLEIKQTRYLKKKSL